MSSRDPDELRAELRSIDFSGDPELLPEFRDEARETVDNQVATLNDIDTKASRILRLNIVLIGVLVSAASIAAKAGSGNQSGITAVEPFLNVYMQTGVGALVGSTAFAAMTYTTSELDVGLSSNNLKTLLESDFSRTDIEELVVKNYIVRINFNRSTNIRNIPLIQLTILLVIAAIVSFSLGLYTAVIGPVSPWLLGTALALLATVTIVSGLPTQLRRAGRDWWEWR
ncbi:hypothetical protein HZS55_19715 [Halosimplex rubrum]|uniref:Uncharacterized protein n=1 Tax=Halosimplex rubrum TaxID=869889 RepID=A0A7D5P2K7_9EURY|nr:hypothetical protein [Halosimplex rubrum]QLH79386.1 hypothetical protein HZS55_19715 [Halosimplex rubrum]